MAVMTKPIAPKQQVKTRSAVERIGVFAAAARPERLTAEIRQLFKRNILDSIGCAIAAVAMSPPQESSIVMAIPMLTQRSRT